jgi:hypothetical protein
MFHDSGKGKPKDPFANRPREPEVKYGKAPVKAVWESTVKRQ